MTLRTIKGWYLVHKWTSLVCTLFLLLLCVTGLPLIFYEEIDHALGNVPQPAAMPEGTQRTSVDRIVQAAAESRPGEVVTFLSRDEHEPDMWFVTLGETIEAPEASSFLMYDARTAEFLSEYPLNEGIMYFFFSLHYDLFAGLPGTLFLGFMGLLFVASLVSGAVLYGPYMKKLRFGTVRRERAPRIRWLDIHNLLGIVTLVWLFVVGLTGVVNTLAIPILGLWQQTQLADMTAGRRDGPAPTLQEVSIEGALAAAAEAAPGMQLSFMAMPGNPFASPNHFVVFMHGETALSSRLLKPVLVDARTSEVVDTRELPWWVTTLLLSQPLHFGDYGGLPLKILWTVLDLLAIVVLGSGLYLWLKRRNVSFEAWLAGAQGERAEAALVDGVSSRSGAGS